jgi:hypothetical protein
MRAFRVCCCCLLLALLLGDLSCTSCNNLVRSFFRPPSPLNHPVTISNCTATPKWFPARNPDMVTWTVSDANTYSIDFDNKTPLSPPQVSIPTITSSQSVSKTLLGDSTCTNGHEKNTGDCYFEYRLFEYPGGSKTLCSDPGIHMVN